MSYRGVSASQDARFAKCVRWDEGSAPAKKTHALLRPAAAAATAAKNSPHLLHPTPHAHVTHAFSHKPCLPRHTHTHLNNSNHYSKEAKLLKTMKFPPAFSQAVDLSRVNWEAVRPWIAERVTALLGGVEDDVLIGFISEQLEGKEVSR
jgi:hypothetical protein